MILQQELGQLNARPPVVSFGINMLGPVLLEYGTEEQKLEHMPKIVRGEIVGVKDIASLDPDLTLRAFRLEQCLTG